IYLSISPTGHSQIHPEVTYCEYDEGIQTYPHPTSCNEFYLCVNGTLTYEYCENGLLYDGKGSVYNHCYYHWGVNCEDRKADLTPLGQGNCEYQFGLYAGGPCETYFLKCVYGNPIDEPCTPGLVYDEKIHGCNWPDLVEYCNPSAAKFLPFPRYPSGDCGRYIVCVDGQPRLVGCGDSTVFDEETLSCQDPKYVPKCSNYFK
ncbi:obstructor-E-like 3, partial [Homarus americanus]